MSDFGSASDKSAGVRGGECICGGTSWVWEKYLGEWKPCLACADADGYPRVPLPNEVTVETHPRGFQLYRQDDVVYHPGSGPNERFMPPKRGASE